MDQKRDDRTQQGPREWVDTTTIEKLERVEAGMIVKMSAIRKEVEERRFEKRRKRRLIVFNLRQSEVKKRQRARI